MKKAKPQDLFDLLAAFDQPSESTVTSSRLPTVLHDAVRVAVALGMDTTANDATNQALRERVEAFALHLALEEHFREHPDTRPSLAQVALAAARLDGDPLGEDPELVAQAADEIIERWPDATPDDVLIYASALARHGKKRRAHTSAA
jgi:hypothetical protein